MGAGACYFKRNFPLYALWHIQPYLADQALCYDASAHDHLEGVRLSYFIFPLVFGKWFFSSAFNIDAIIIIIVGIIIMISLTLLIVNSRRRENFEKDKEKGF